MERMICDCSLLFTGVCVKVQCIRLICALVMVDPCYTEGYRVSPVDVLRAAPIMQIRSGRGPDPMLQCHPDITS